MHCKSVILTTLFSDLGKCEIWGLQINEPHTKSYYNTYLNKYNKCADISFWGVAGSSGSYGWEDCRGSQSDIAPSRNVGTSHVVWKLTDRKGSRDGSIARRDCAIESQTESAKWGTWGTFLFLSLNLSEALQCKEPIPCGYYVYASLDNNFFLSRRLCTVWIDYLNTCHLVICHSLLS